MSKESIQLDSPGRKELPQRLDDIQAEEIINSFVNENLLRSLHKPFNDGLILRSTVRLILELGPKLKEYDTVIGDDVSGRVLALLLHKIISAERVRNSKPKDTIYFVSSGKHYDNENIANWRNIGPEIEKFLRTKKDTIKKALFVTEYIESGITTEKMCKIFQHIGIDFDIASLSVREYNLKTITYRSFIDKLYFGDSDGIPGLLMYVEKVTQNVQKKVMETGTDLSPHTEIRKDRFRNQKAANAAREDINLLAERLEKLLHSLSKP